MSGALSNSGAARISAEKPGSRPTSPRAIVVATGCRGLPAAGALHPEADHPRAQGARAQAQRGRGALWALDDPPALAQHPLDVGALDLLDPPWLIDRSLRRRRPGSAAQIGE